MPKLCPNITFPHQQDFFPIRSVTKSSTARFSHENLVEKFKIFVQDFVPIRTALSAVYIYKSLVGVMLASSPSISNVASAYSLKSSVRGTSFFSFMEFMVYVLSCGCVRRICSCVCV